jgi:hypothetical protein
MRFEPRRSRPGARAGQERRIAPMESSMEKNAEKKTEQQKSNPSEEQKREEWKNKNGPVLIVGVAVLLIAALCVAMKMCG